MGPSHAVAHHSAGVTPRDRDARGVYPEGTRGARSSGRGFDKRRLEELQLLFSTRVTTKLRPSRSTSKRTLSPGPRALSDAGSLTWKMRVPPSSRSCGIGRNSKVILPAARSTATTRPAASGSSDGTARSGDHTSALHSHLN